MKETKMLKSTHFRTGAAALALALTTATPDMPHERPMSAHGDPPHHP